MKFRNPLHFQIQTKQSNHASGQLEEVRQPEVVVRSLTIAYTSYFCVYELLHHDRLG